MTESPERFVALDLHKMYIVAGAVNAQLEPVLPPRRVLLAELDGWAPQHLRPRDTVVIEAGSNAWYVYDLLQPLVARVLVANPRDVQLIASARVKTDRKDVLILARLLAAQLIPEVWVPPPLVRQLRALIRHRERLVGQRAAAKNRLHALLLRHHLVPPDGNVFALRHRDWWAALPFPAQERLLAVQNLVLLDQLSTLIQEAEQEITRLSGDAPWADQVAFLIQLPGIGVLSAMVILAAIGEIDRFPAARNLVGYAGLGARVHASGQTHRSGGITKEGRRELRAILVQVAWVAVRDDPFWRAQFGRLETQVGKNKAIVAIARKLLVVIWYVLTERQADRQANLTGVARALMTWGARHRLATSQGLSRPAFVRRELDRLGLGQELSSFQYHGHDYPLPPSGLVITLADEPTGEATAVSALEKQA